MDLIKRDDAIKAVCRAVCHKDICNYWDICGHIVTLLDLPSVEPEIIRCKDCKYCIPNETFHTHWCRGRRVLLDHYCGYAERKENE